MQLGKLTHPDCAIACHPFLSKRKEGQDKKANEKIISITSFFVKQIGA